MVRLARLDGKKVRQAAAANAAAAAKNGHHPGRQAYVISLTKEEGRECVMSGAERAKGFLKRARQIMRIYIPD